MPQKLLQDGICEVDGGFFGRRKLRSQKLVIGAINQKTKQIRLKIVKYRTRAEAEKFIQDTIKSGSLILTDGFKGYNELNDLELILREWENRHNNPNLFYNEDNYLKTACFELFR